MKPLPSALTRIASRIVLATLGFTTAFAFFIDSSTNTLYPHNPSIGRAGGCYTALELFVGLKHPSVLREVELLLAIVIFVVSFRRLFGLRWSKEEIPSITGGAA